jgi:hypothetical protein
MHFPNLPYLAVLVPLSLDANETFATIAEFWTCPVLTHLCIDIWDTPLVYPSLIPNLVSCYSKTRKYLEIFAPTTASGLYSILQACPSIAILVISAPVSMTLPVGDCSTPIYRQLGSRFMAQALRYLCPASVTTDHFLNCPLCGLLHDQRHVGLVRCYKQRSPGMPAHCIQVQSNSSSMVSDWKTVLVQI